MERGGSAREGQEARQEGSAVSGCHRHWFSFLNVNIVEGPLKLKFGSDKFLFFFFSYLTSLFGHVRCLRGRGRWGHRSEKINSNNGIQNNTGKPRKYGSVT